MSSVKSVIGGSQVAEGIRDFINKAARFDFPVLLSGETGVGKEVIAQNIHFSSHRQNGPFVPVDCSCISASLAESELFGHRKGSFTDCKEDKVGLIEAADHGTIFFDELADLSVEIQPKLLRVLENREVRRIGEVLPRRTDARFSFATNKDLKEEVKVGRFRKDLFYRINVLYFHIPPLRERKEDLPLFVQAFMKELNARSHSAKKLSYEALRLLLGYSFPGNIRELEHILSSVYAACDGEEITAEQIPLEEEEEEEEEEETITLYRRMLQDGESFWRVIHKPFICRDLSRREVRKIVSLGFKQAGGSYKELMAIFNAGQSKNDYKKFMSVLACHRLKSGAHEIRSRKDVIK